MHIPLPELPADPRAQARADRRRFWNAFLASAFFVVGLWWLKLLEGWLGQSLGGLGVRPGEWSGLVGVLAAPLINGDTGHLVNNSLPLLVLGTLLLAVYPRTALRAIAFIWIFSGLGIWVFGRESTHIGASGLSHGLMFLLLMLGVLRRDRPAVAAAMIAFFMYGGMLLSVLPGDPQVSWEAHLFGALSGAVAGVLWRKRDPAPARRRYSWEDEEEAVEPLFDELQARERGMYEPPPPANVPVLWHRVTPPPTRVVVQFRPRPAPPPTE